MSESLRVNRQRAAQYVADQFVRAQLKRVEAERLWGAIVGNDPGSIAYEKSVKRLREVLHRFLSKQPKRVGISVDLVCTLLELDQKTVQKYKDHLGYDRTLPLSERYDYHAVRQFGVGGHGAKAGKLVYVLGSGGVIVGTFLGTNAELEQALMSGATLSLKSLPAALASPWKDKDEREFWQDALLKALERASRIERT